MRLFVTVLVACLVFPTPHAFAAEGCELVKNINDPATIAWTAKLLGALSADNACNALLPDNDHFEATSACNIFVGRVLHRVYGIDDFIVKPVSDQAYYQANDIATELQKGIWDKWKLLGTADNPSVLNQAKVFADAGNIVLAVWRNPDPRNPGHIALIGPGPLTKSGEWNMETPASASFPLGKPQNAYLGKPLACAFRAAIKGEVQIWARLDLPSALPAPPTNARPAPPTGLTATVQ